MDKDKKRFSIGTKMYLFVIFTVFSAAFGAALLSFAINVNQIDNYFKTLAFNTAKNFSTFVDAEFLSELREVAESEEYQKLRDKAEAEDNEQLVEDYLTAQGLWEDYEENRGMLIKYLRNMENIKYLYIIVWGDENALYDMYLMDDDDNALYTTGYYEDREPEFYGMGNPTEVPPTISHGAWGWLCSAYYPVYDENGSIVCHIGCDVGMDDIMKERRTNLTYVILTAIILTLIMLAIAMLLVNRAVVSPLNSLTNGIKKFSPSETRTYEESNVLDLEIKSKDEIQEIYQEIRSMQKRIIDYLHDLTTMQKDKEKAENDMKKKEQELGKVSREAYRDSLTSVGNKAAYIQKITEINNQISDHSMPKPSFAIVMVDVNCLKVINDNYGHTAGDTYLKGCCHVICDVFKHSPVYRIGGDEFIAILQRQDYEERLDRFNQLVSSYDESYHRKDIDPWLRFSAAAGMAEYASDDNTVELVFKRADKAMYEAKMAFKEKNGNVR